MRPTMRGESSSGGELKAYGSALRVMPRSMRKRRIWLMMIVRWRTRLERARCRAIPLRDVQ
jgi:hypothetical protein